MLALRRAGRIRQLSYDGGSPLFTAWDPGYTTAVWVFQPAGPDWVILGYKQETGWGMEQWSDWIKSLEDEKGWRFTAHYAPFDTEGNNAYKAVAGESLKETAAAHGLNFEILEPEPNVLNGIERTRRFLFRCWFDEVECANGLESLDSYGEAWKPDGVQPDGRIYLGRPEKSAYCHGADAARYMSLAAERIVVELGVGGAGVAGWDELAELRARRRWY
jgi:phage terminase large subunit